MGAIVVVLLLALVLSAAVMLYAAYPYRGEETPLVPRLGEAMRRGVQFLPTLDLDDQDRLALELGHGQSAALDFLECEVICLQAWGCRRHRSTS